MLLLHPLPACADAGFDLCTFCPDLCTLRLWCYSSINQRTYSTCTHGGGHWLQLVLMAFFLQPLAPTVLAPNFQKLLQPPRIISTLCACAQIQKHKCIQMHAPSLHVLSPSQFNGFLTPLYGKHPLHLVAGTKWGE